MQMFRQRGSLLVEALIALGIAAAIMTAAVRYGHGQLRDSRVNEMTAQVEEVVRLVRALYGGEADYEGLDADVLLEHLPNNMNGGASIATIFGPIQVEPAAWAAGGGDAEAFQLSFKVPKQRECIGIVRALRGRWPYMHVNGGVLVAAVGATVTPGQVMTRCGATAPAGGIPIVLKDV